MTRTTWHADLAWLPDGLAEDVTLVAEDGRFTAITASGAPDSAESPHTSGLRHTDGPVSAESPEPSGPVIELPGVVLPGFANAHSHAFHRALRGRTHDKGGSFWTWRERMYAVAARLDPASYLALATATYAEMALSGVTAVGEFHYLHHGPGGVPYADPNAMGRALIDAAAAAGIRLTLLDTCYLAGGLGPDGHLPLDAVQRRFGDGDVTGWARRFALLAAAYDPDPTTDPPATDPPATDPQATHPQATHPQAAHRQTPADIRPSADVGPSADIRPSADPGPLPVGGPVRVGAAIHSVRAVPAGDLPTVARAARGRPLHVHLSEQPAENAACLAHYAATPTALLTSAGVLGPATTAVHATHLSATDLATLGTTGTTVCFCPTTERDLADGIGPARRLLDAGAPLCLGSDQHAVVDLLEEARALEMDERLASGQRGRLSPAQLVEALTAAGQRSIGWPDAGELRVGARADLVAVRLDSPRTAGCSPEQVVLAAGAADVDTVVVDGRTVVAAGRHLLGDVGRLLVDAIGSLWETG